MTDRYRYCVSCGDMLITAEAEGCMARLRLICRESDSGAACNVGGPVIETYRTFDVEVAGDVWEWLARDAIYNSRRVIGVEVLQDVPTSHGGE